MKLNNNFKTSDGVEYSRDEFGVIHQLNPDKFDYNQTYVDGYRSPEYKEKSSLLMGVRMGCVVSQYSHIFGQSPDSILDFGYGDGSFLNAAKEYIPNPFGFDVSPEPTPNGVKKINDLSTHFDVITFWDALEHVHCLDFVELLNANMLVISLPNLENKVFDTWKHRKPDEHIHHFTKDSILKFMMSKGWTMISHNYMEDIVRKGCEENILTSIFVRL